jgi:hypothetical protein
MARKPHDDNYNPEMKGWTPQAKPGFHGETVPEAGSANNAGRPDRKATEWDNAVLKSAKPAPTRELANNATDVGK